MKQTGCLVFYYSSRESSFPVRDVRCNWHKGFKPEPNIETETYGRFACCNCAARNLARREFAEGRRYILFLTNYQPYESYREQTRVRGRQIIGYYKLDTAKNRRCNNRRFDNCWWWHGEEIAFYYPGLKLTGKHSFKKPTRFIINWKANSANFQGPCRGFWKLDSNQVELLLEWFESRPKRQRIRKDQWREEVKTLENKNIRQYGLAYPNLRRKRGFSIGTRCK